MKSLREARRMREDGRALNQAFITLVQTVQVEIEGQLHTVRCGSTLILDLDDASVTYVVRKGLGDMERMKRTVDFRERVSTAALASTYFGMSDEPFAALHTMGA